MAERYARTWVVFIFFARFSCVYVGGAFLLSTYIAVAHKCNIHELFECKKVAVAEFVNSKTRLVFHWRYWPLVLMASPLRQWPWPGGCVYVVVFFLCVCEITLTSNFAVGSLVFSFFKQKQKLIYFKKVIGPVSYYA